jgi:hypothetical protein
MHESLRSVRWSWIGFGWFIAVALTSLVLLALEAFGIIAVGAPGEALWVAIALVVGFLAVGLFVGTRVAAAPFLHGVGMGLFSLVAWFLVNLLVGEPMGQATWRSLEPLTLVGLLVLQTVAAVVGTRMGVRWVRRGAS